MDQYFFTFELESDAHYGSAAHRSVEVDAEVQHDAWGCPFLSARTLKGLLVEEMDHILHALKLCGCLGGWKDVKNKLCGQPGSREGDQGQLKVSHACLPIEIRDALRYEVETTGKISRMEVLHAFTSIRRQTSIDEHSGAARDKSLRSLRVILRTTPFQSEVQFTGRVEDEDLAFLAAAIHGLRHTGGKRNRGLGLIGTKNLFLNTATGRVDILESSFEKFATTVLKAKGGK